jgi:hypothetical protein
MCTTLAITACYIVLLSAAVLGAPLAEKESEVKKRSANQAPDTPEKDLQDLLNLVHKESNHDGVVVHKEQVSHIENNNGKQIEVQAKEEKVVDTNTGKLIADVKQEVKQESAGSGAKPETVVETKVDIPAEGVHETFVQEGEENENGDEGGEESLQTELTPADMAEYLYATQRFPAFYAALGRLVNQSKMSPEEAEMYTKAVALEYERLQLEDFEESVMAEKRMYPQVPQDLEGYGQEANPDFFPNTRPGFGPEDRLAVSDYYGLARGDISPEEQLSAQQELQGNVGDIDPLEFLAALWNEAYGKGNEEAQEIVKMLYDRVSQDDNPDDMGQIRDLLVETIAASMNEEPLNDQAEETQPISLEAQVPSDVNVKPKEAEIRTAEKVKEVKEALEKQAAKSEQKVVAEKIVEKQQTAEKETKVTKEDGNKADQQKQ